MRTPRVAQRCQFESNGNGPVFDTMGGAFTRCVALRAARARSPGLPRLPRGDFLGDLIPEVRGYLTTAPPLAARTSPEGATLSLPPAPGGAARNP